MENRKTLYDVARVIRSKNSGPFSLTLDILFDDAESYQNIKAKNLITKSLIAKLYKTNESNVTELVYFDSALGIKITMNRSISSGSSLDTDVYGAQQYAPLMEIPV